MTTSGQPTSIGGAQSVSSSYLRSISGMLGAQGGSLPSQSSFPHCQFSNLNMVGKSPDVSSFINQTFTNGGPNSALSVPVNGQHGGVDPSAELDPLSCVENGMNYNNSVASFLASNMGNLSYSSQNQGPQFMNLSSGQSSMQPFSASLSTLQPQQHQLQSTKIGLGGVGLVKLEPQVLSNDQQEQQALGVKNLGAVKLEAQRLQPMRGLAPVKSESQHSDQSLFLHQQQQQQQQQQILQMSRQSSQAAAQINLLHQQQLFQLQQQQQLLKAMPQQRLQLHQQLQQQNLPLRSPSKPTYKPLSGLLTTCISNNTDPTTIVLNSGESLLLSTLLPMPKRSGVFPCTEMVGKQLEYFPWMHGTVKYATTSLAVVLKRLLKSFPGCSKPSMKVVLWRNFFMLIYHVNIIIHLVRLSWIMQKLPKKVFLSNFALFVTASYE